MIDVLAKDQPQVLFASDQHPVQALAAGTGYPALRDRVRTRRLDRSPDHPHADGGEDRVERRGELGIPVADDELEDVRAVLKGHQKVPGLLRHPLPGRMSDDPGQVHLPPVVLDALPTVFVRGFEAVRLPEPAEDMSASHRAPPALGQDHPQG
ncbi:MAG TPA: hypothetical protein VEH31_20055 [Streptosporangiaceae bacterium]|nr:hypothetical protein [Streptosporangiaceae bacterium]